jgi:hypothetical protein
MVAGAGFILATTSASALVGVNASEGFMAITSNTSGTVSASTSIKTGTDVDMEDNGTVESTDESMMITNPVNIKADDDLKTYTSEVQTSEENVSEIDTDSSDSVSVSWENDADLFGFIPVKIDSKTTVSAEADNTIKVVTKLPWWSMFVTGVNASTWAQSDMKLQESSEVKENMSPKANAAAKAHVVHAVVSRLSAETKANASTTAKVTQ